MSELPYKDGPDKDLPGKDLPDEQQLEEYLRGGSAVSRQYRQLPNADVPAELDRLVLRQAQEAVKAQPAKSRRWVRWTGPLALAASAVLVVSIVIESGVHEDTYLTAPASAPVEMTMKQEAAEQPAAASAAETSSDDDASMVHVVPVQPPSAADMDSISPPASFLPEEPAPSEDRALAVQPVAPAPAPQFTSPPPDVAVDEAPARSAPRERANAIAQQSATTIAPAPAAAVTQSAVPEADRAVEEIIMTGARRHVQKQTAGPRNTVVPATADSPSRAAEEQVQAPRNYSDPEQWLRDIRELRKQKKHEDADREWRRFGYVFPNYEVAENDPARGAPR